MKQEIGIIGLGTVGGSLLKWLHKKKMPIRVYDKFKKIGELEDLEKCKIIFLCLPTPYNPKTGYNLSALIETIKFFQAPKIFVIKSTVLPETTESFQKKYQKHKFLFNPEFLREAEPWETFINSDLQIMGYTSKSKKIAKEILKLLPKGKKFSGTMSATEGEIIKQAVNSFLAIKVIFANQIYELSTKLKANYENVKKALESETRLGGSHFDISHAGYRGFGGKCLPKEFLALTYQYKKLKLPSKLLEIIWQINFNYLKKQKLLKRLYSNWLNNKS